METEKLQCKEHPDFQKTASKRDQCAGRFRLQNRDGRKKRNPDPHSFDSSSAEFSEKIYLGRGGTESVGIIIFYRPMPFVLNRRKKIFCRFAV